MKAVLENAGQMVRLSGRSWSGTFPLERLPEQLRFHRTLRDRKRGKYAACYQPTVDALEALAREIGVPVPRDDRTAAGGADCGAGRSFCPRAPRLD